MPLVSLAEVADVAVSPSSPSPLLPEVSYSPSSQSSSREAPTSIPPSQATGRWLLKFILSGILRQSARLPSRHQSSCFLVPLLLQPLVPCVCKVRRRGGRGVLLEHTVCLMISVELLGQWHSSPSKVLLHFHFQLTPVYHCDPVKAVHRGMLHQAILFTYFEGRGICLSVVLQPGFMLLLDHRMSPKSETVTSPWIRPYLTWMYKMLI